MNSSYLNTKQHACFTTVQPRVSKLSYFLRGLPPNSRFLASLGALSLVQLDHIVASVPKSSYFLGDPPPHPCFLASLGVLSLVELDHVLAGPSGQSDSLIDQPRVSRVWGGWGECGEVAAVSRQFLSRYPRSSCYLRPYTTVYYRLKYML
jgi:hypothetical protein